jgi:hypothetical protein
VIYLIAIAIFGGLTVLGVPLLLIGLVAIGLGIWSAGRDRKSAISRDASTRNRRR